MLPLAVDTNAAMIAAIREGDSGAAGEVTRNLVRRAWTMARESFEAGAAAWAMSRSLLNA
jgi:DNA-binding GntR family transcriptional regulator